jgi:hypothetical protein
MEALIPGVAAAAPAVQLVPMAVFQDQLHKACLALGAAVRMVTRPLEMLTALPGYAAACVLLSEQINTRQTLLKTQTNKLSQQLALGLGLFLLA